MSGIIERAAMAHYEKYIENVISLEPSWFELEGSHRQRMVDAMRAGLGVMREPTKEMLIAAVAAPVPSREDGAIYGPLPTYWHAMIDAALKEP